MGNIPLNLKFQQAHLCVRVAIVCRMHACIWAGGFWSLGACKINAIKWIMVNSGGVPLHHMNIYDKWTTTSCYIIFIKGTTMSTTSWWLPPTKLVCWMRTLSAGSTKYVLLMLLPLNMPSCCFPCQFCFFINKLDMVMSLLVTFVWYISLVMVMLYVVIFWVKSSRLLPLIPTQHVLGSMEQCDSAEILF
jgi:hypothetical protein